MGKLEALDYDSRTPDMVGKPRAARSTLNIRVQFLHLLLGLPALLVAVTTLGAVVER
jgi:hypothetical protein